MNMVKLKNIEAKFVSLQYKQKFNLPNRFYLIFVKKIQCQIEKVM